jgi:hypothetical protein
MRWSASSRRIASALPLALTLSLFTLPASATHLEIQGGRSYMDSYGSNTLWIEGVFNEHPIGQGRFTWAPDASIGWVNGRNVERYRYSSPNTMDDVYLLAAGARFHYGDESNWYHHFFASIQAAGQTGRTQALSSGYEFVSTVGWQAGNFSLQIRHVSNASLKEPNRGETMALAGVGFDF